MSKDDEFGIGAAFGGDAVAGDVFDEDLESVTSALIRDLGLARPEGEISDTSAAFRGFLDASPDVLGKVGIDVSIAAAAGGDWKLALEITDKVIALGLSTPLSFRLWRLRCLAETARFAEALAMAQAVRWENEHMIHVNYLTGLAFESLGMRSQARVRFEAVRKQNPAYRDIAMRVF